ncbi:hypothetical protein QTN47_19960 [Danxiaibacter flavus]|uniref:Uncharacterized protein n=1 Tax=Danxiaibacter flavus TaxID=3049108 RepID=A0ABV3ZIT0_9BACT|nr:hypothetical protein QNM32_19970 [Chitinophagaceae bacterium DXS]
MYIELSYLEKKIRANVIYNFRQMTRIILVRFDNLPDGKDNELFLFFENNQWIAPSDFKEFYPEMLEQIMQKLKSVFNEFLLTKKTI